jgi:dTDP-4-amino-4,6-dideoxygalactose transaminase
MNKAPYNHIPFALPDIGDEEINAVVNCMRSGWLTTGVNNKKFEEDFATYIGPGTQTVSVNSATAGLFLALEALGIGPGDEVIVPTYTFSATAMVVVHLGARPVLVDVDHITLNIDQTSVSKAVNKKTKAIIVVHLAGLSADLTSINQIAKERNIHVIEDAAHALPATHNGQLIGDRTSDATIYSFYATKTMTTGEGGMIVTHNPDIAKHCRIMRLHGFSRDAFDRYTKKGASWNYEIIASGFKYNLTDIASCIGIEQLKKVNKFLDRRTYIANLYLSAFHDLPIRLPATPQKGDVHSWHLFIIRLKDEAHITRDDFISSMSELFNISCSVHFIPLHLQPFYQEKFGYTKGDFRIAEKEFSKAISLPIYTKMSDEEVSRTINAVRRILHK